MTDAVAEPTTDSQADPAIDSVEMTDLAGDRGVLGDTLEGTLDLMEAAASDDPDQVAERLVPTGFEDLDDLLGGGLWPGHLVVVGGRTSMGTTTLVLDFARAAAVRRGIKTLVFGPETAVDEVNLRLLAATAKIPINHLRNGTMNDADWTKASATMGGLATAPLTVDSRPYLTLDDFTAAVEDAVATGTRLVILDGVQTLVPLTPRDNRYHELCEQVHAIKRLARAHRISIVVTSKLNRDAETRGNHHPKLHDLRNAGDIEDVADLVILLHRDDYYEYEPARPGEADLFVDKNRHGPTRSITLAFQGHYSRFMDIARHPVS